MTQYEEYWDTLVAMWDNKALQNMLEATCYTYTPISEGYIDWVHSYAD